MGLSRPVPKSFEQIIIRNKLLFKSLFLQLDETKCGYRVAAQLAVKSKNLYWISARTNVMHYKFKEVESLREVLTKVSVFLKNDLVYFILFLVQM